MTPQERSPNRARYQKKTSPKVKPSAGATPGVKNVRGKAKRSKLAYARAMRRHPTESERLLWSRLRSNRLGVKFRHQAIILGWIADFWCPKLRLVVEVDGRGHAARAQRERDVVRCNAMAARGILTIRFWNEEVTSDLDDVCARIFRVVAERSRELLREPEERRSRGTGASLKDRRQRREATCDGQAAMSRLPEDPSGADTSLPIRADNGLGTRRGAPQRAGREPRRPSENGEGGTCS